MNDAALPPLELPSGLRVALVHDWLNGMRGGERVLEHFCALFPQAHLHTLLYEPSRIDPTIRRLETFESPFARLPGARKHYRYYLPAMPAFVAKLPTADYDLVISTSHCVAKAAPRPRRGLHLSYIFSPMRYVWDHFEDYLSGNWWKDGALRALRPFLQRWDRSSCKQVDSFAADSEHIARKVKSFWGREAQAILPPVQLERFSPAVGPPEDFFLVVSALVPYKKIDRAIEAARLAKVKLVVVGDGPERRRLQALAPKNVEFAGRVSDADLPEYYRRARALLYPATEDYGITAIEAQACGRPVLAFRHGGVTETVIDGETGAFFDQPDARGLAKLLKAHDDNRYDPVRIRQHAERFSPLRFRAELIEWINRTSRFAW